MTIRNINLKQLLDVLNSLPKDVSKIDIESFLNEDPPRISIKSSGSSIGTMSITDEVPPTLPSEGPVGPSIGPDDDIIDYM